MKNIRIKLFVNDKEIGFIDVQKDIFEKLLEYEEEILDVLNSIDDEVDLTDQLNDCFTEGYGYIEELLEIYKDDVEHVFQYFYDEELNQLKYYRDVYPCGYFPDPYLFGPNYDEALSAFCDGKQLAFQLVIDSRTTDLLKLSIEDYVTNIVEIACGRDDVYDQNIGFIIEKYLDCFIEQGYWHIGLIDECGQVLENIDLWPFPTICDDSIVWEKNGKNYDPIIWFGIAGELPSPCWSLTRDRNYLTGLSTDDFFQFYNWYEILGQEGGGIIYWAFCEAYDSGPDPERMIKSCPIEFYKEDIVKYVAKYQMGDDFIH